MLNCSLALNGVFCFPEVIVEKVLLSLKKRTCGLFVAYLAVVPTKRTACQDDDKTVSSLIAMHVILVCCRLSLNSRGSRPRSKVWSEHMIDWQHLSLGTLKMNFSLKVNLEVFLCLNV